MGTHYLLFKKMFAVGRGLIVISIAQGSHLPKSSISLLPSERKEEETDSLAFTMVLSPSGTQTSCTAKHQTTSLCPQKQSLGLSLLADPSNHHEGELLSITSARESSCPSLLYLLSLNPRIPAHSVSHLCTGCLVGIQLLSRCHFLILTTSWSTTSSSQCHEAQRTEHSISTFY